MPFRIVRNDISKMHADAIVNTANSKPVYGRGVDKAIYKATGIKALLSKRKQFRNIEAGKAVITPAYGISAKYIIHTAGPVWNGGNHGEVEKLKSCYDNSLQLALENHCESIALPLISTGTYGYPKDKALQIAISAISEFLLQNDMMIYLVVFGREAFQFSGKLFTDIDNYIDENYVGQKCGEEYRGAYSEEYREDDIAKEFENCIEDYSEETTEEYAENEEERALHSYNHLNRKKRASEKSMPVCGSVPDKAGSTLQRTVFAKTQLLSEEAIEFGKIEDKERAPKTEAKNADKTVPKLKAENTDETVPKLKAENIDETAPEPKAEKIEAQIADSGKALTRSLEDVIDEIGETFQERLLRLIDIRQLTNAQVYKKANLDRKLFSKILCNPDYHPKKRTVVAFAIALELNLDETKDLLARAEFALSPSSKFDLIIEYFIERRIYDVYTINMALFEHEQPMLGE